MLQAHLCSAPDALEAALIPDVEVYPVISLHDLYLHLTNQQVIKPQPHVEAESVPGLASTDFREIKGQEHVKRASKSPRPVDITY